jgi:hypothetical protein
VATLSLSSHLPVLGNGVFIHMASYSYQPQWPREGAAGPIYVPRGAGWKGRRPYRGCRSRGRGLRASISLERLRREVEDLTGGPFRQPSMRARDKLVSRPTLGKKEK